MPDTDLADLKARIPVVDALARFGAKVQTAFEGIDSEVEYFCPWCDDLGSRRAAGRASLLKNVFHCWSCGKGGSVIDAAIYHLEANGEPHELHDAITLLLTLWPAEDMLLDPWSASDGE